MDSSLCYWTMGMHILTSGQARLGTHTGLTQPSNFILTPVPGYIWIPFLEIGWTTWTVFTFNLAVAKTYH